MSLTAGPFLIGVVLLGSAYLTSSGEAEQSRDFAEAGIPAASREWQGCDYLRAAQVLETGTVRLPRFADPQGEVVLRRMISNENLSFHRNKALPLQSRLDDYIKLQRGANSVLRVYSVAAVNAAANLSTEMAHLLAFMLHVSALGVELLDEFLPTIPKDNTYATRMDGVQRMYSGLTTVFVGAEVSLNERSYYSPEDLSAILDAMATTLPRLKKAFAQDYRIELRRKLTLDRAQFKRDEDTRKIDRMIRELDAR